MALVSEADLFRLSISDGLMPLRKACHDGWSVQLFCTGSLDMTKRRLCVMGPSIGGQWFRPPAYFTDTMVIVMLMPKKNLCCITAS